MSREFDLPPASYADEIAELSDRDTDLYRIDPNRREAEDHAAGFRTGGHLEEQWTGSASPSRASELSDPDLSSSPAESNRRLPGPIGPGGSSSRARKASTPPSPTPAEVPPGGRPRRGAGEQRKDAA